MENFRDTILFEVIKENFGDIVLEYGAINRSNLYYYDFELTVVKDDKVHILDIKWYDDIEILINYDCETIGDLITDKEINSVQWMILNERTLDVIKRLEWNRKVQAENSKYKQIESKASL